MAEKKDGRLQRIMDAGEEVLGLWSDAMVTTHASSAAYYFFMSFIPVTIIIACIVSHLGLGEEDMLQFFSNLLPEAASGIADTVIHESYSNASLALTLSLFGLLWTASGGSSALALGLNAAYGVEEERDWLYRTLVSLASVLVLIALYVAGIYLIFNGAALRALSRLMPQIQPPGTWTFVFHSLLAYVAAILVFAMSYTFLTSGKRSFRAQLPGASLAATGWIIFTVVFRIYMYYSDRYTLIYGSLATVAIFLFWLYCVLAILLLGGLFNRCLHEYRDGRQ